jgi:hypothetical protein
VSAGDGGDGGREGERHEKTAYKAAEDGDGKEGIGAAGRVVIDVGGMTCATCAAKVEKALARDARAWKAPP